MAMEIHLLREFERNSWTSIDLAMEANGKQSLYQTRASSRKRQLNRRRKENAGMVVVYFKLKLL